MINVLCGRTVLIASAAYIGADLEIEFGRIPPCFLPIGNSRLFVKQYESVKDIAERIIISLPEDYELDEFDACLLSKMGVETVFVPVGLSLGNSVITVMNLTASAASSLFCILHGDTLLKGVDFKVSDAVSIEIDSPPGYHWGFAVIENDKVIQIANESNSSLLTEQPIFTGWFSFSDPVRLIQGIARQGGDFLNGIADYTSSLPLKALNTGEWFDFGHSGTFYSSRRKMSAPREFNRLNFEKRTVTKSSTKPEKIEAEAQWFSTLPAQMRIFTPAYLGKGSEVCVSYSIEYLNLPTLSDLFVFGRLPKQSWERIFLACNEFLTACLAWRPPEIERVAKSANSLYLEKTIIRLEEFSSMHGIDLNEPCKFNNLKLPSLNRIAHLVSDTISPPIHNHLSLVHGDFCFSNILYDHRSDSIRVIDPRGHDVDGKITSYGDIRYDVAKLHHSAIGKYDYILAGCYQLQRDDALDFNLSIPDSEICKAVAESFVDHKFAGLSSAHSAPAISILLFLSMLPLHADVPERQIALLANALRLFVNFENNFQ